MVNESKSTAVDGTRVLVVDDDPDLVTLMVHQLSRAGYRVFTAFDGEEALQVATAVLPEVAVLDMMMPKLSGAEVLGRLRACPATRGIRVILVSASFDRYRESEFPPGADDYIGKPFSPREVPTRVQQVLARPPATVLMA